MFPAFTCPPSKQVLTGAGRRPRPGRGGRRPAPLGSLAAGCRLCSSCPRAQSQKGIGRFPARIRVIMNCSNMTSWPFLCQDAVESYCKHYISLENGLKPKRIGVADAETCVCRWAPAQSARLRGGAMLCGAPHPCPGPPPAPALRPAGPSLESHLGLRLLRCPSRSARA